jgi:hypothetical protein
MRGDEVDDTISWLAVNRFKTAVVEERRKEAEADVDDTPEEIQVLRQAAETTRRGNRRRGRQINSAWGKTANEDEINLADGYFM